MLRKCEVCIEVGGRNFEHYVWPCYFCSCKFNITANISFCGVFSISEVFDYTTVSGKHFQPCNAISFRVMKFVAAVWICHEALKKAVFLFWCWMSNLPDLQRWKILGTHLDGAFLIAINNSVYVAHATLCIKIYDYISHTVHNNLCRTQHWTKSNVTERDCVMLKQIVAS